MKDKNGTEYSLEGFFLSGCRKKIVVFGAGNYGAYICDELEKNGYSEYLICDNNRKKLKILAYTHNIIELNDLIKNVNDYIVIIAVIDVEIIKSIKKQLIVNGFKESDIVIPIPESRSPFFDFFVLYDKELSYLTIVQQWINKRNKGRGISDYFEKNNLYNLIVYEADGLIDWLREDLNDTNVSIVQVINNTNSISNLKGIDAFVVLDEVKFDFVQEELMKKYYIPVIGIWDVIR